MINSNKWADIEWHGLRLRIYFVWHKPEPWHNWPGGVDSIEEAVVITGLGKETDWNIWPHLSTDAQEDLGLTLDAALAD